MLANLVGFIPSPCISAMVHLGTSLTHSYHFYTFTLKVSFSPPHTSTFPHFERLGYCLSMFYWEFELILPKTVPYCQTIQWISYLISYVLLSTSYLTTLIVCRLVLLLILIIMVILCVCFKLIWSFHSLLAFSLLMSVSVYFFEYQLENQSKLPSLQKPQLHKIILLFSIYPIPLLIPYLLYMVSSKVWSRLLIKLYYNKL